jgi:2',3'-cyclic-nucleotide 2'-phosphodiesterase (5'-nucleotidase family)
VVFPLPCLAQTDSPWADSSPFTILFTGDTGGRLKEDGHGLGGMARRATAIDRVRKESPGALLVDIGDFLGPDHVSIKSEGKLEVLLLGELKYDAVTLGNHDFVFGLETLRQRLTELARAGVTVLTTNLADTSGRPLAQPYLLKTMRLGADTVRVLLLGLADQEIIPSPTLAKQVKVTPPVANARKYLEELSGPRPDLVVALCHIRQNKVVRMAPELPEVDVFICLTDNGYYPGINTVELTSLQDNRKTLVVNASSGGLVLGRLDARPTPTGRWTNLAAGQVVLDHRVPADEMVSQTVFVAETQADYPIVDLAPTQDHPDSMIAMVLALVREKTRAEVALLNRGMFNLHAFPLPDHRLTINSLYEFLWTSDHVVRLKLTYKELKALLDESRRRNRSGLGNTYLHSLGLDIDNGLVNGKVANPDDYYTVATNDFLANGGDGYAGFLKGMQKQELFIEQGNYLVPAVDQGRMFEVRNEVVMPGLIQWKASRTLALTDLTRKSLWKMNINGPNILLRRTWWDKVSRDYGFIANYPPEDFLHFESRGLVALERLGRLGRWKNELALAYGKDHYNQVEVETPNDLVYINRYELSTLLKKPHLLQTLYPFLQLKYDSEIVKKKDAPYKQLDGYYNLGLGLGFWFFRDIRFSAGAFKNHAVDSSHVGFNTSVASLFEKQLKLLTPVYYSNRVNYEWTFTSQQEEDRVTVVNVFEIPLVKSIALRTEINYYAYRNKFVKKFAQAADSKMSLSYQWTGKWQSW